MDLIIDTFIKPLQLSLLIDHYVESLYNLEISHIILMNFILIIQIFLNLIILFKLNKIILKRQIDFNIISFIIKILYYQDNYIIFLVNIIYQIYL